MEENPMSLHLSMSKSIAGSTEVSTNNDETLSVMFLSENEKKKQKLK